MATGLANRISRRKPVERRFMMPEEVALARAFADVSFPPATMHKRMARNFTDRVSDTLAGHEIFGMISEGEARVMRNIAWRFRRQLPKELRPGVNPKWVTPERKPEAPAEPVARPDQDELPL